MYTQCPECRTAYQIGPDDLRRAHGRVRCGGCGTVFDALQTLSHEPPPAQPEAEYEDEAEYAADPEPPSEPGPEPPPEHAAEEPAPPPEPESVAEAEPQRFDDDTPLEEILASFGGDLIDEEGGEGETGSPDQRGASPSEPVAETAAEEGEDRPGEPPPEEPGAPEGEDLGDEGEWRALLAELELDETVLGADVRPGTEISDARSGAEPRFPEETTGGTSGDAPVETPGETPGETHGEIPGETPGEMPGETPPEISEERSGVSAAEPAELTLAAEPGTGGAEPEAEELPAGEAGHTDMPPADAPDTTPEEAPPAPAAATIDAPAPEHKEEQTDAKEHDELAASAALFDEIVQSGEFAAILGPDADAATAAAGRGSRDRDEAQPASAGGDTGTTPQEAAGEHATAEDDEELVDQALVPRRRQRSQTLLWSVAAALLVAVLGLQVIHGQRAQLATHPDFGPRLQHIYGALGMDVQPRWDIGALCVESSSGDAGANTLEIASVIAHEGDRPQPYPLLQVALTDRWQSVIGSRSIAADDYLPSDGLRADRLFPGDRVRASARLADPGSEAAGYELHVCYRNPDGDLRCSGACR